MMPRSPMFWLQGFVLVQTACQIALLFPQISALRIVLRTAAFAVSLAALAVAPGRTRPHPSQPYGWIVVGLMALAIAHPSTNGPVVALAQNLLYLAILGPLFWVSRLAIGRRELVRLLFLYWGFQLLSAGVGVLQVYFPGEYQPALSSAIDADNPSTEGLKITLADGSRVWRPMGLTDAPGGASGSGLYAGLFGLGFFALSDRKWLRAVGVVGFAIGLFCILLSQVRVYLVLVGICSISFAVLLVVTGRVTAAVRIAAVTPAVAILGFGWAASVGGDQTTKRFESLFADDPDKVYQSNRGMFLENAFGELLPTYPLGAGLGRWGMTRGYFGGDSIAALPAIWVEIQWQGWILDGGFPLMVAYALAILVASRATVRVAGVCPEGTIAGWAALIAAYDIAVIAITFSYSPFIGQFGLDFWLLNATVWTAAWNANRAVLSRQLDVRQGA